MDVVSLRIVGLAVPVGQIGMEAKFIRTSPAKPYAAPETDLFVYPLVGRLIIRLIVGQTGEYRAVYFAHVALMA